MHDPFANVVNILDVLSEFDAVFFDLYGVIFSGKKTFDGVVKTINTIIKRKPTFFISNSPRVSSISAEKLRDEGIDAENHMVFTSGEVVRMLFLDTPRQTSVYYVDEMEDTKLLEGIEWVRVVSTVEEADNLIISASLSLNGDLQLFDDVLKRAAIAKIPALCANPDYIAIAEGEPFMCSRYFAKKFERIGGKVTYFGKPEESIFRYTYQQVSGLDKSKILMVGDTLYTDILGAHNFGINGGLVVTGNTGSILSCVSGIREKLCKLEKICYNSNIIPDYVLELSYEKRWF